MQENIYVAERFVFLTSARGRETSPSQTFFHHSDMTEQQNVKRSIKF